jgi:hypothetical protein
MLRVRGRQTVADKCQVCGQVPSLRILQDRNSGSQWSVVSKPVVTVQTAQCIYHACHFIILYLYMYECETFSVIVKISTLTRKDIELLTVYTVQGIL